MTWDVGDPEPDADVSARWPPGGQGPADMPPCRHCGHPAKHHSANECWTNPDGTESQDVTCGRCPIGYDPGPKESA